jgi:hypothetical protein
MSKHVFVSGFVGLALTAAIGVVGCGGDDDGGGDPAQVTEDFFNALADGDGETACGLLSDDGLENIPEDPEGCPDEVANFPEEQRAQFEDVSDIEQVTGETEDCGTIEESDTEAETVATVNGDVECINLSNVDGEWKINDI